MTISITPFLRNALLLDAAVSGAAAMLMAAGASLLAPLLALPQPLLFWAGLALFPFVALLVAVSRRAQVSRATMQAIVAINALWVLASFGILVVGAVSPNMLGIAFVAAQAIAVAGFAVLQSAGMKQASAA